MVLYCKNCPLYKYCREACQEVYGAPLAGVADPAIEKHEECPIYLSCKGAEDMFECVMGYFKEEYEDLLESEDMDWEEEEEDFADEEEWYPEDEEEW